MLSLFVEFFRAYAEALSAIGLVIGAAALTLAGIAFTRSQAFRGYMGGEHKQNLQNFEAMLRGCLDTMHGILLDSKDEERYFRSLEALLVRPRACRPRACRPRACRPRACRPRACRPRACRPRPHTSQKWPPRLNRAKQVHRRTCQK